MDTDVNLTKNQCLSMREDYNIIGNQECETNSFALHSLPKQVLQEQPNGQFQITENGALNLMKADSMDMLVVNNLAQDLSITKEESQAYKQTSKTSPDTSLDLNVNYDHTNQGLLSGCILPVNQIDSSTVALLNSDINTSSLISCIDNVCPVIALPQVEVLTSELTSLQEKPPSPELTAISTVSPMHISENKDEETIEETEQEDIACGLGNIFTDVTSSKSEESPLPPDPICCQWKGCSCTFTQHQELVNHVNMHHVKCEQDEEYKCHWQNCPRKGRGFNARYKILIHLRTHTNEKPHCCSFCNKSFSRLENLKIHTRTHTGEKPYVCPVPNCSKAYANSSDRFKHVRTHKEDKPFVCKMQGCGKKYTDPSSLRKHIKNHGHRVEKSTQVKTNGSSMKDPDEFMQVQSPEKTQMITTQPTTVCTPIVTLLQNTLLTQSAPTQVISINGTVLQISNLISNPLLSSTVVPSPGKQSTIIQTAGNNLIAVDVSHTEPDDNLVKDGSDMTIKDDFLTVQTETSCLTANGEVKIQDSPLDLSTCTGLNLTVSNIRLLNTSLPINHNSY